MRKTKWGSCLLLLVLMIGLTALLAACGEDETTATGATATTVTSAATATTEGPGSSATTGAAGPTETLKIGALLSLTDWWSVVDAPDKVDLEFVAKMINDDGGIKVQGRNYMVELVFEEGKSSLDGNTAAATKLVLDDKVRFVVGPGAFFNTATTPIFEQNKVLHVASYNALTPAEMNKDTTYAFLGLDPVTQQSAVLKALKEHYPTVKTVSLATEDATFPTFGPHFKALAERTGLTLAGDPVLTATNAEDYNSVASRIKAQNPDAVWLAIGIIPTYAGITKGLRTLGYEGPIVCPANAAEFLGVAGAEASTNVITVLSKSADDPNMPDTLKRLMQMGDPNRQMYLLSPNALYMLKYAIEAADSLDPTAVRDKWQTMTSIPTLYGAGFPTGAQLYGLAGHAWAYPVPVALLMNGKIELQPWVTPDPTP